MEIEQARLERFEREVLKPGSHESVEEGMCVMELAAYLAGEKHSDNPSCCSPVISSFLRSLNDRLDDDKRQLLKPYAIRVIGTAATPEVEDRRSWLAADWLIRVYTSAWLDLAGLAEEANQIRALPVIDSTTIASALPTLSAAEQKAYASWRAARSTESEVWNAAWEPVERVARSEAEYVASGAAEREARSAAWIAAESVAWSAAEHASSSAVWHTVWSATWNAALNAAKAAAFNAARIAAENAADHAVWRAAGNTTRIAAENAADHAVVRAALSAALSVAESAARSALKPTVEMLQQSAVELLDRMIMVKKGHIIIAQNVGRKIK